MMTTQQLAGRLHRLLLCRTGEEAAPRASVRPPHGAGCVRHEEVKQHAVGSDQHRECGAFPEVPDDSGVATPPQPDTGQTAQASGRRPHQATTPQWRTCDPQESNIALLDNDAHDVIELAAAARKVAAATNPCPPTFG
ncbi:hypothetical protein OG559_30895 [Micromonospora sp. NBC_01405]|uniref:hypothetical protein n=1 Tax=Micromonospora sp. NBC_01405 TaxID=2903589 RepID=UPI0032499F08